MHKKRLIVIFKKRTSFLHPSPGIKQEVAFIGDMYSQSEAIIRFQKIKNLFTEVMDINYYFSKTGCFQFQDNMFQHRSAGYRNKRFGHRIGQWSQTATQTGCKYHCFH